MHPRSVKAALQQFETGGLANKRRTLGLLLFSVSLQPNERHYLFNWFKFFEATRCFGETALISCIRQVVRNNSHGSLFSCVYGNIFVKYFGEGAGSNRCYLTIQGVPKITDKPVTIDTFRQNISSLKICPDQQLLLIWSLLDGNLRQMFSAQLVFLRGDLRWATRSPDLSICYFFLWGYLKKLNPGLCYD